MNTVLTVIGDPASRTLDDALVETARAALDAAGATVGAPDWLAPGSAVDLYFDGLDPAQAEAAVRRRLARAPVDMMAQAVEGRRKGLLVADMESTIIAQEMVDELADLAGIRDQIAAITARSMAGEIDFAASLEERVALLAGLPESHLEALRDRITLNPGARSLVQTLRAGGGYTALVTGGFACFAEPVARLCGFDEVRSNHLVIEDDRLGGTVAAPILGPEAKRVALVELAAARGLSLAAACAVGDGANDRDMVRCAGLGVAYRGKPVLKAAARVSIDHGDLTALLYLQGYWRGEFRD